jgi:hypothetical protein
VITFHNRQRSLIAGAPRHRFLSEAGSNVRFWQSVEWPAGRAMDYKEFE